MPELHRSAIVVNPGSRHRLLTPERYHQSLDIANGLYGIASYAGCGPDIPCSQSTVLRDEDWPTDPLVDLMTIIGEAATTTGRNLVTPNDIRGSTVEIERMVHAFEKPLFKHLTYLSARYLVQSGVVNVEKGGKLGPDPWYAGILDVVDLVKKVPDMAKSTLENEAEAYSVTYDHFDQLRYDTPGGITEVYLGRDGVFAYHGRLGQLAARGGNEPTLSAYPSNPDQTPVPRVRYVIYSQAVRHSSIDQKREYLLQFLAKDDVSHFFDTGFVGSAPRSALEALGVEETEFDSRTHLLKSSSCPQITIPNIPEYTNAHKIEDYEKDISTVRGIVTDSSGVIVCEVDISPPASQFNFSARKHILYRYFMAREHRRILKYLSLERTSR